MNLLSGTTAQVFSLLSIGQRGVGKTVFLAGSYAELHPDSHIANSQQLWFDCQGSQVQENIERLLSYVARTGQYPPLTIKTTNFNFSLKHHRLWSTQTLCHFRWCDIPGEICNIRNQDFQTMVLNSHGCCVFIDACALMHNNAYLQTLEDIIEQVEAIAYLVSLNRLKYAFAVILTKCDLLELDPLSRQQLKEGLQPLTSRLDAIRANYQTFYSSIPIVHIKSASTLRAKGAAAPLLWLVRELSKAHKPGLMNNLSKLATPLLPSGFQPGQELVEGSLQSLFRPAGKALGAKKILGLYLPAARRNFLLLTLAIGSLVGVIGTRLVDYKQFLQGEPKNLDTLSKLATLRQSGQFDQAVSLIEKLVQQEPERLELRLQLAGLYEVTGQVAKAETAYDQVLAQQNNNLQALVGKATLRKAHGDIKTAEALFAQAEKAAPSDLKAQIRAVTQKTLQMPAQPVPSTK
jgi:tetratricopeptide (TPR) repeat protein